MPANRLLFFTALVILWASAWTYPGKVLRAVKAPYGCSTELAYDGTHLWMADYRQDKLLGLNPKDGSWVHEIHSPGFWPMGLAWAGNKP